MSASYWAMLAFLAAAILLTLAAEACSRRSERVSAFLGWAAVLCCFGVCVGLISALLAYWLQISEWITLAVGLPLGVPLLLLAARAGEV